MLITSRSNTSIRRIRGLRARKERDASGLCFVEGIRLVIEAAELDAEFDAVVVAPDLLQSDLGHEIADRLERKGVVRLDVSGDVFASLSAKDRPQGLAAVVRQQWEHLDGIDLSESRLWVTLVDTQDPGNLGSIMRTCDAVGAQGVVLLGAGTDPYDPAAVRASMGAVFSQRLVRASASEFIAWTRRASPRLIGTSDAADVDYRAAVYREPMMLLMGSEREGLSTELLTLCDDVVAIPMVGRSDSLNLAVATGIVLYEIFHQSRHND